MHPQLFSSQLGSCFALPMGIVAFQYLRNLCTLLAEAARQAARYKLDASCFARAKHWKAVTVCKSNGGHVYLLPS